MEPHRPAPRRRFLALAAILLIFSLGCLCMPTGFLTTSTPTPTPALPPAITPIPPATDTALPPTATFPPIPSATIGPALTAEGPWLLIETNQGLWAANQDGSGLTQLTTADYWRGQAKAAVQPGGHEIAVVIPVDNPAGSDLVQLTLNVISLPAGDITMIADLGGGIVSNSGRIDPLDPAARAITDQISFAWSPDGSKLAFIGAIAGASADLYIYDEPTGKITRASTDPDQDFSPSWSPDGKHIVYLEAKGFGTGAGMAMAGAWVAGADGSNPVELYQTDSAGEDIDGWLDNTTVLLDTWDVYCGPGNLRLLDVVSGQTTLLNEGCITSATASGWRQLGMYANDSGLYMISAEDKTPKKVDDTPKGMIKPWGTDDQIFTVRFQNASLATFGMSEFDHQVTPITSPPSDEMLPFDQTDVAIYGAIWGWTSRIPAEPGVWITGPGIEIGRIFENAARFPAWSPDNNLLFFAPLEGGYDLYRTTFDTHYTDLQVVNHLDADIIGLVWLGVK